MLPTTGRTSSTSDEQIAQIRIEHILRLSTSNATTSKDAQPKSSSLPQLNHQIPLTGISKTRAGRPNYFRNSNLEFKHNSDYEESRFTYILPAKDKLQVTESLEPKAAASVRVSRPSGQQSATLPSRAESSLHIPAMDTYTGTLNSSNQRSTDMHSNQSQGASALPSRLKRPVLGDQTSVNAATGARASSYVPYRRSGRFNATTTVQADEIPRPTMIPARDSIGTLQGKNKQADKIPVSSKDISGKPITYSSTPMSPQQHPVSGKLNMRSAPFNLSTTDSAITQNMSNFISISGPTRPVVRPAHRLNPPVKPDMVVPVAGSAQPRIHHMGPSAKAEPLSSLTTPSRSRTTASTRTGSVSSFQSLRSNGLSVNSSRTPRISTTSAPNVSSAYPKILQTGTRGMAKMNAGPNSRQFSGASLVNAHQGHDRHTSGFESGGRFSGMNHLRQHTQPFQPTHTPRHVYDSNPKHYGHYSGAGYHNSNEYKNSNKHRTDEGEHPHKQKDDHHSNKEHKEENNHPHKEHKEEDNHTHKEDDNNHPHKEHKDDEDQHKEDQHKEDQHKEDQHKEDQQKDDHHKEDDDNHPHKEHKDDEDQHKEDQHKEDQQRDDHHKEDVDHQRKEGDDPQHKEEDTHQQTEDIHQQTEDIHQQTEDIHQQTEDTHQHKEEEDDHQHKEDIHQHKEDDGQQHKEDNGQQGIEDDGHQYTEDIHQHKEDDRQYEPEVTHQHSGGHTDSTFVGNTADDSYSQEESRALGIDAEFDMDDPSGEANHAVDEVFHEHGYEQSYEAGQSWSHSVHEIEDEVAWSEDNQSLAQDPELHPNDNIEWFDHDEELHNGDGHDSHSLGQHEEYDGATQVAYNIDMANDHDFGLQPDANNDPDRDGVQENHLHDNFGDHVSEDYDHGNDGNFDHDNINYTNEDMDEHDLHDQDHDNTEDHVGDDNGHTHEDNFDHSEDEYKHFEAGDHSEDHETYEDEYHHDENEHINFENEDNQTHEFDNDFEDHQTHEDEYHHDDNEYNNFEDDSNNFENENSFEDDHTYEFEDGFEDHQDNNFENENNLEDNHMYEIDNNFEDHDTHDQQDYGTYDDPQIDYGGNDYSGEYNTAE